MVDVNFVDNFDLCNVIYNILRTMCASKILWCLHGCEIFIAKCQHPRIKHLLQTYLDSLDRISDFWFLMLLEKGQSGYYGQG